jgi:hypothetical protein
MSEGPPTYQVTPATTSNEAVIREAVDRFTAAGLDLPSLQIVFSDDERACNGHLGLFESSQQPWRVTICSDLAFVPFHELAHAWIRSNIDQPTRERYLQIRNKPGWNSPDLDWNERGVEDAAFVIQQNLTTNRTGELDDEWKSRATAYEFLTRTVSPLRKPPPGEPHSTATSPHRQQATTQFSNTAPSAPAGGPVPGSGRISTRRSRRSHRIRDVRERAPDTTQRKVLLGAREVPFADASQRRRTPSRTSAVPRSERRP